MNIFVTIALTISVSVYSLIPAVHAQATPTQVLQEAEIEREKLLVQELKLSMPEQTEDPSYPVTFVDPSQKGVDLTIDGKTIAKAPSPYILPNLSIGTHTIAFAFKNSKGEPRYLQKTLLITPKAPIFDQALKTRVVRPNAVVLLGTALPQSTVLIVVNSSFTHSITSNTEGKWEFIIPEPVGGENNVLAFTIRNGIVSNPSKTFTFEYLFQDTAENTPGATQNPASTVSQFLTTMVNNIDANRRDNPTLFYGIIGVSVLLILLMVELSLRRQAARRRDEKTIESLFSTHNKGPESIIDVIKTGKKGNKKEALPPIPEGKMGVLRAFDDLKKEMVEKDIYEEEDVPAEKSAATPKKGGFFSLFRRKPAGSNIPTPDGGTVRSDAKPTKAPKTGKVTKAESVVPAPAAKVEEKKPITEPVIDVDTTKTVKPEVVAEPEVKAEKVAKKLEMPTPEVVAPKEEKKVEVKIVHTEKQAEVEVSDETEEPEKKVLTKEEFLKQFKKVDED